MEVIFLLVKNSAVHGFFLFGRGKYFSKEFFDVSFRYFFEFSIFKFIVQLEQDFSIFIENQLLSFLELAQFIKKVGFFIMSLEKVLTQRIFKNLVTDFDSSVVLFKFVEAGRHIHENRKL